MDDDLQAMRRCVLELESHLVILTTVIEVIKK